MMKIKSARNLRDNGTGGIDCEILIDGMAEWLPYTARDDDAEPHGLQLHADITAGRYGEIAAPVDPVQPVPTTVTNAQAVLAMEEAGVLDAVETWLSTQPRPVQIEFERRQTFEVDHPIVQAAKAAMGWGDDDLRALFALAATK